MRMLLPLAVAILPALTGCATTNASVPHVDRSAAIELVRTDLETLLETPDDVHWKRTYRHFDRHLEPHLSASDRLRLEVRFGSLRQHLKLGEKGRPALERSVHELLATLQPQD